jgi:transposase
MPWVLSGCRESGNLTNMKNYILKTPDSGTAEQAKEAKGQNGKIAKEILLGVDAHLNSYQVGRKIDQSGIQPVQSFGLEQLLSFAQKQIGLAEKVYAVYEAGPLGYVLYRKLRELGVEAMVCAPESLEAGSKRKHNKMDAAKLTGRLFNHRNGDRYALRVVKVPEPQQEQLRAESRQHDQLVRTRKALGAQGRALCLSQGYPIQGNWWRPRALAKLCRLLPDWMVEALSRWQANLMLLDEQIASLKIKLANSLAGSRPKGCGALSLTQLEREIFDWERIKNPRAAGCFAGLCPSEHSSGKPGKQRLGAITKVGNPRIRVLLIEMVWRLLRFQPDYGPISQWREQLQGGNKARKKKAAVAVARRLFIDLWRIRTGQIRAEELGFRMVG